jgi:hypothetical protein
MDYDQLDTGIREIVRTINLRGYATSDSGDGCSKPAHPDVLPFAHVAVPSNPLYMVAAANHLFLALDNDPKIPIGFQVQASYDPKDRSAIILVTWPWPLPKPANV